MCDAMSPEFKAANDILIRIIKTNDRTDGVPYPRLVELNKAFKANDVKAARVAYDKLVAFIPKGEKTLHDELNESQEKLTETTKQIEASKKALAQEKAIAGMFDKFAKTIDTAKANPKMLPKLNAYAEKLKQYGDFSKRIAQAVQMDKAGKDVTKQCDMLKKAVADGKAKHAKAYKLAESEFAKVKNRLAVYKEAVKIRRSKIADFGKEKDDIKKLAGPLLEIIRKAKKENKPEPTKPESNGNDNAVKNALAEAEQMYLTILKRKEKYDDMAEVENRRYKDMLLDHDFAVKLVDEFEKATQKDVKSFEEFMPQGVDSQQRISSSTFNRIRKMIDEFDFNGAYRIAEDILDTLRRWYPSRLERGIHGDLLDKAIKLEEGLGEIEYDEGLDDFITKPQLPVSARKALFEKYMELYTGPIKQKIVGILQQFGIKRKAAPASFATFKSLVEAANKKKAA